MTSFGRGRGILPSKRQTSSTIPIHKTIPQSIQSTLPPQHEADSGPDMEAFEKKLSSTREENLFPLIYDVIEHEKCTVKMIEKIVKVIFDLCLLFPQISKKYAELLNILAKHKKFGHDIKSLSMSSLETLFEERDDLLKYKKFGESSFRNAAVLTGEVYYRFRIVDHSRYAILARPLLDYLTTLAKSNNEKDILVLAQQIAMHGCEFIKHEEEYNNLLFEVRRSLIDLSSYSEKAKWILLFCYELSFSSFGDLSESVQLFYQENVGGNILSSIRPSSFTLNPLDPKYFDTISHSFNIS